MKPEEYPLITDVVMTIAQSCGAINRVEGSDHIQKKLEYILNARDMFSEDLDALENWLRGLTKEQRDILADGESGEEGDMLKLVSESPFMNGRHIALIFQDFWEIL